MVTQSIAALANRLRTLRIDVPGVRWLGAEEGDGPALRALITDCYGDTYSYKNMYQDGYIESLWASDALLSLGELSGDGALIGHTGFWTKDPRLGYLESGLSLVAPTRREGLRVDYQRVWRPALEALRGGGVGWLHQNTTTLHPMAQFYALKHMRARPTGFILGYTRGERVYGLNEGGGVMHALTMTTPLRPEEAAAALPDSPWRPWLAAVAAAAGVPTCDDALSAAAGALQAELIERNDAIGLLRLALRGAPGDLDAALDAAPRAQTLLLHVPALPGLSALFDALLARGFVPTGLRPQQGRVHEWTLQRLADDDAPEPSLAAVQLATDELKALWEGWRTCARR